MNVVFGQSVDCREDDTIHTWTNWEKLYMLKKVHVNLSYFLGKGLIIAKKKTFHSLN